MIDGLIVFGIVVGFILLFSSVLFWFEREDNKKTMRTRRRYWEQRGETEKGLKPAKTYGDVIGRALYKPWYVLAFMATGWFLLPIFAFLAKPLNRSKNVD